MASGRGWADFLLGHVRFVGMSGLDRLELALNMAATETRCLRLAQTTPTHDVCMHNLLLLSFLTLT